MNQIGLRNNKLFNSLTPQEQEDVYRHVWCEHVKADVRSYADDEGLLINEAEVCIAAERFVYDGDYDCNRSYWTNIYLLIKAVVDEE